IVNTFTVDALRPDGPYVLPIGAGVNITLPNNHWQYALTWYGIALGLVGVYFSWHRQAGRLGHKEKS
ncbi:MAG: SURF1 family protein, partial [Proteobacteria bacterium]|nr:SURF1 family protein [Pseudomonadota bacterium]